MLVHRFDLVLNVLRCAQSARLHRHGLFPCTFVFAVAGEHFPGKLFDLTVGHIPAVTKRIEIGLPFGCLLDGGPNGFVYLFLQAGGELVPGQISVEADMLPGGRGLRIAFPASAR